MAMINKVKVLDCTLRDGGYINNWQFGEKNIRAIIENLVLAGVDIIETGFIRECDYCKDLSVFQNVDQIKDMISPKASKILYAAMIEQHNYNPELISQHDEKSVDIIRVTFHRNEWKQTQNTVRELMNKGYKVCVQPVGTVSYEDKDLLTLIEDVNKLKPYAFYLVDTLGVMYQYDMRKLFYLVDDNLSQDICLGFHSHNNLQMSFANAQELIRLNNKRTIIVDSACYGMGRGVGNLVTELFIDYANKNIEQKYEVTPVLKIVDKYLMPIYAEHRWGYDLPYFISATVKCHPNYAAYLIKKETLEIEKIEKILNLIPENERNEYNPELIEQLYIRIQGCEINDEESYRELIRKIGDRDVLILGLGASIIKYEKNINNIIKKQNVFVIALNFIPINIKVDAVFVSNEKRITNMKISKSNFVIATSNLIEKIQAGLFFNYTSLLGEGDALDNAGAMVIRVLRKLDVKKVYMAGFDGYDVDASSCYALDEIKKMLDYDTVNKKNREISKQLKMALKGMEYELLTPTKYKINCI
ncbi:4-hydroxy-2-oxovalerate aldolase 4 [uncultured Clostridium sp.]|nr:4-hydroxy-2-oxovalerate aldolase 4 [uncultured Clostridium sp.]